MTSTDRPNPIELWTMNRALQGYVPIEDHPKDWGRIRNAKCFVRGHSFDQDAEYYSEPGPGSVCGICQYEWPSDSP